MKASEHCLDNEKMGSEVKGRIIGVKVQIQSFDLYIGFNLTSRLYLHTDNICIPATEFFSVTSLEYLH